MAVQLSYWYIWSRTILYRLITAGVRWRVQNIHIRMATIFFTVQIPRNRIHSIDLKLPCLLLMMCSFANLFSQVFVHLFSQYIHNCPGMPVRCWSLSAIVSKGRDGKEMGKKLTANHKRSYFNTRHHLQCELSVHEETSQSWRKQHLMQMISEKNNGKELATCKAVLVVSECPHHLIPKAK